MAVDVTKDGKYIHSFDGNFYVSLEDYEQLLAELNEDDLKALKELENTHK